MSAPPDRPVDQVNQLIFGRWKSQLLYAAVRLRVFDALHSGPRTCSAVCAEMKLDLGNGYRLLRALACIGLLQETADASADATRTFALTEAGACLRTGHPSGLREVVLLQEGPEHTAIWKHLPRMVREGWQNGFRREFGVTAFEYADSHPEYSAVFDAAMASYSVQQAAAAVEALRDFDFSGVETVCDVGGGQGKLIEVLLQAHPQLRGMVLERPAVVHGAPKSDDRAAPPGAWSYCAGDMFQSVPCADLYLLKLILHDWDDDECVRILANIRDAARASGRSGARLLILEFVITPPEQPHFSKLYDIHMMCWGEGRERSLQEYEELLQRAGWQVSKFRELPAVEMGIIEARLKLA